MNNSGVIQLELRRGEQESAPAVGFSRDTNLTTGHFGSPDNRGQFAAATHKLTLRSLSPTTLRLTLKPRAAVESLCGARFPEFDISVRLKTGGVGQFPVCFSPVVRPSSLSWAADDDEWIRNFNETCMRVTGLFVLGDDKFQHSFQSHADTVREPDSVPLAVAEACTFDNVRSI